MQKIVMREGVAMLIEETVHDIVDLEEFKRAISMNRIETPLLPFGCVLYTEKAGNQTFCIIRQTEIREMNQANVKYRLAMPHRIYTVNLQSGVVRSIYQHFIAELPSSTAAPLLHAPFPNRHDGGDICSSGVMIAAQSEPIVFRLDHIINQVERTRHNTDLMTCAKDHMPDDFKLPGRSQYTGMLQAWQNWTENHAEDWRTELCTIGWKAAGNIASIVKSEEPHG